LCLGNRIPSYSPGISRRPRNKDGGGNVMLYRSGLKLAARRKLGIRKIREEQGSLNGSIEMTASHLYYRQTGDGIVNRFKSW